MITNGIIKSNVLGLEAVTMFNGKPYFFVMADIDSHDRENLLNVLKFFENRKLSCYTWATTKGYHVLSPCLLTFRRWAKLTDQLRNLVPSYRFDCLRMSNRKTDGKMCYFHQWNYGRKKESATLHKLMCTKLRVHNIDYKPLCTELRRPVQTVLKYVLYKQLNFTSRRSSRSAKTLETHSPHLAPKGLRDGNESHKGTVVRLFSIPKTIEECKEAQIVD